MACDHTNLPANHTAIHKWNELCLPLLPSRRASLHFSWYWFPTSLRVASGVGMGGSIKYMYWGGLPARRRSSFRVLATSGEQSNSRPSTRKSNVIACTVRLSSYPHHS